MLKGEIVTALIISSARIICSTNDYYFILLYIDSKKFLK